MADVRVTQVAVEALTLPDPDTRVTQVVVEALTLDPVFAPPDAPSNVAASALGETSIRVTWDNVANETGYRVDRSPDGTTGWTDVSGNLAADTVQYDDTGLTASTQYFYRVYAFNAGGDSPASTVVNATTDAAPSGGGNRMGGTGAIRRSSETTQRLVRRGR